MKFKSFLKVGFLVLMMASCTTDYRSDTKKSAHATFVSEQNIEGEAKAFYRNQTVVLKVDLKDLEPGSKHGFHIHENGDCVGDFKSAGGHFSPNPNSMHAAYENPKRHGGDLGNVVADENGEVHIQKDLPGLTLYQLDRRYSILGRSLILHKKADDLKSQPSGAAGSRIACAVVR